MPRTRVNRPRDEIVKAEMEKIAQDRQRLQERERRITLKSQSGTEFLRKVQELMLNGTLPIHYDEVLAVLSGRSHAGHQEESVRPASASDFEPTGTGGDPDFVSEGDAGAFEAETPAPLPPNSIFSRTSRSRAG